MKKHYWILTLFNEECEIEDQDLFENRDDAYNQMKLEYEFYISKINKTEDGVSDFHIDEVSAYILYSNEPLMYTWKIKEIIKNI